MLFIGQGNVNGNKDHEIISMAIPHFCWFKKGSNCCQLLAKLCALVNHLDLILPRNSVNMYLTESHCIPDKQRNAYSKTYTFFLLDQFRLHHFH